ncbi:O-sialoglycoprotein endopeptidase [Romboutsia lituseburensis]|uniref:Kae1-like domain-containing protein n=1 Tax=Romboutsia lituseburensis TaxID=1537 RepID=UPI00215AE17B|nr:O-sialoglycoprotein endopeptidase [Romboutsia lituseburensis]MCR8745250.1 O-sialoglycoprotein endopeptidase [Romboutsia lituseburensis]
MSFQENNIIIGIDTSCYTTSIAAISLGKKVIFNKKIMLEVKNNSKGLRQSEAVFQHVKNLGELDKELKCILKNYNIKAICVSSKPRPIEGSYMPVFTVGLNFAKLLSSMINCEIYETTHQENHIEASLLTNNIRDKQRFLSVHMSGGTTEILLCRFNREKNGYDIDIVGGTKDISFGQLIDRIGVEMGYNFPAGKYIDENATSCNQKIEQGLKTSVKDGYMNLSGLENQIKKIMFEKDKEYTSKLLLDAVVRNMLKSIIHLAKAYNINEVVFAGGVSASKYISKELVTRLKKYRINAYFTKTEYSTDNAVGCAAIGVKKIETKGYEYK